MKIDINFLHCTLEVESALWTKENRDGFIILIYLYAEFNFFQQN